MSWEQYENAGRKGPFAFLLLVGLTLVGLAVVFGAISYGLGWFSEAGKVAQDEFGPKAMLRKYEWFKDAAAQCERKLADIKTRKSSLKALEKSYAGDDGKQLPRNKWSREDREQYNQWLSEIDGLKSSYNDLAAQYNAAMAKFNYRFTNVGDLPEGAKEPLPREVKPYIEE